MTYLGWPGALMSGGSGLSCMSMSLQSGPGAWGLPNPNAGSLSAVDESSPKTQNTAKAEASNSAAAAIMNSAFRVIDSDEMLLVYKRC